MPAVTGVTPGGEEMRRTCTLVIVPGTPSMVKVQVSSD